MPHISSLHRKLFLLLLLLLPLQTGYHFWPPSAFVFGIRVDYLAPTVYLTDILVVLLLLAWMWDVGNGKLESLRSEAGSWISHFSPRRPVSHISLLTSSLLVYLIANSLLIAQNQPAAVYKLVKLAELFLLGFYIFKEWGFGKEHRNLIQKILSISIIYASIIGILQFFKKETLGGIFWFLGERTFNLSTPGIATEVLGNQEFLRAYSIFSHPNSFAGFLLVALVLSFPWDTKLKKTAVVLGGVSLFLTFSQTAWLAALFLGGVYLLRIKGEKALKIAFTLAGAITLLALLPQQAPLSYPEEIKLRIELAQTSGRMFVDNPLFGVGLNNFVVRLPDYGALPSVSWWLQPVHNIFLLVLAETGLIGFGFFLWLLFLTIRRLVSDIGQLATGNWQLAIALLGILITGALDHYWLTLQQNQLLASIVLGLLFSKQ